MAFSFSKKYNSGKIFEIDPSGFEYKKIEELWNDLLELNDGDIDAASEEVTTIRGLYIGSKSLYNDGASVIAATDSFYLNLPYHVMPTVKQILSDREAINAINNGKVGITLYPYQSHGKDCVAFNWVDIK